MMENYLGSHNTMSYLKPKKWWMRLFNWIGKCQSEPVMIQIIHKGVRFLDFRIKIKDDGSYCFAHGKIEYQDSVEWRFNTINAYSPKADPIFARVVLENPNKFSRERFYNLCEYWKVKYPNIEWQEGLVKPTFEIIYDFDKTKCTCKEDYASYHNDSSHYALFPYLYAILHNRKAKRDYLKNPKHNFLMIDFVNVGK
jgi:hypothetical protein